MAKAGFNLDIFIDMPAKYTTNYMMFQKTINCFIAK